MTAFEGKLIVVLLAVLNVVIGIHSAQATSTKLKASTHLHLSHRSTKLAIDDDSQEEPTNFSEPAISKRSSDNIKMVTSTLKDILASIEAEAAQDADTHKEYTEYVEEESKSLTDALGTAKPELESTKVQKETLAEEVDGFKKKIATKQKDEADLQDQMAQAKNLRAQQEEEYNQDITLNTQSITQVTKAIATLQKVQKYGGFLQNGVMQKLQLNEPGESGYVLGVMKGILRKLEASKKQLETAEAQKKKAYAELEKNNQGTLKSLQEEILTDKQTLTQKEIDFNTADRDIKAGTKSVEDLENHLSEVKTEAEATAKAHDSVVADREGEKAALKEAIRYMEEELGEEDTIVQAGGPGGTIEALTQSTARVAAINVDQRVLKSEEAKDASDAAAGPGMSAQNSSGFLNLADVGTPESAADESEEDDSDDSDTAAAITENAAPSFLQVTDSEQDFEGASLREHEKKDEFNSLNAVIKNMLEAHHDTQKTETDKMKYCEDSIEGSDKKKAETADALELAKSTIEEKTAKVAQLDSDLTALNTFLKEQETALTKAGEVRKLEKEHYQTQMKDRNLAIKVVEQAKKVLSDFYGTKGPGSKQRKSMQSNAAISLLSQIAADITKQQNDALTAENEKISLFEKAGKDYKTLYDEKMLEVISHKTEKGKLSVQINTLTEKKDALVTEQDSIQGTLDSLHTECDKLIKNFDDRKKSRKFEIQQLMDVQDIIAGSSLAVRTGPGAP